MKENENYLKNIYTEESRLVLIDELPLDKPLCISIEPTNICNFKCAMCYHGNNEDDPKAKPLKNIEFDVFEKTLSDIKRWVEESQSKIKLMKLYSLGEPLIHPMLPRMIKLIKESEVSEKLEVTTNGSLLDKDICEKFVDYGLDIIRVSIYSVILERMHRVTGSVVDPNLIKNNVEYLYEYRKKRGASNPRIIAKMLDANSDENDIFLKTYKNIADDCGIDEVFNIALGDGNNAFKNMYNEMAETAHRKSLDSNIYSKTGGRRVCRYPFTHMTIRSDGSVVVCCADWLKELVIGNIMEHSLYELWNSKSLYELRKKMICSKGADFDACRVCEIPYRDSCEDNIDDLSIDRFTYLFEV